MPRARDPSVSIKLTSITRHSKIKILVIPITSYPWAPGDYENWEGTLIKLGGHNINLGGHQWSKLKILH